MRRVNLRQVTGEPVLAAPLVDERGAFVLGAGKPLSASNRRRLWERGFRYAYVECRGFEDVLVEEPLPPRLYGRLRRLVERMIDEAENLRTGKLLAIPVDELTQLAAEACDDLAGLSPGDPFLLYPPWEGRKDRWASFAINAAVLAGLVGLQRDVDAARRLFVAALVQDVGLWRTNRVEDHVSATRDMLRPLRDLSPVVKAVASEHHERLDGSGYPDGKSRGEMHRLSLMMHVVVEYLETVGRVGTPALPHEALTRLGEEADRRFGARAVELFERIVPSYPPGTMVRLTNGRQGVVVGPGEADAHWPTVRLLPSLSSEGSLNDGEEDEWPEFPEIDLSAEEHTTILRVLD